MAEVNLDTVKAQVLQRLTQAVTEIQASMDSAGVNASGRTRASIRVREIEGGTLQLVGGSKGTAPVPTLEVGRAGGDVPKGFSEILLQWSRDKGLNFETESKRKSFAYLLARKIAREGTQRHKQNEDIYSTIARRAADDIAEIIKGQLASVVVGACVHDFNK